MGDTSEAEAVVEVESVNERALGFEIGEFNSLAFWAVLCNKDVKQSLFGLLPVP